MCSYSANTRSLGLEGSIAIGPSLGVSAKSESKYLKRPGTMITMWPLSESITHYFAKFFGRIGNQPAVLRLFPRLFLPSM